MDRYYRFCHQNIGRVARITDKGGRVHVGRIVRVSPSKVYIAPMIRREAAGSPTDITAAGGVGALYTDLASV